MRNSPSRTTELEPKSLSEEHIDFKTKEEAISVGFLLQGEFNNNVLGQKICIFWKEDAFIICRFGPKRLDKISGPQPLINKVVLPRDAVKNIIAHIEGCLIKRKENKGLPWNKTLLCGNQKISVERVSGLGPLKRSYGYRLINKTTNEIFGIEDLLLTKGGFLDFLMETIKRIENSQKITENSDKMN